jgi:hypothetical protein
VSAGQGLALREVSSTLLDAVVEHFAANGTIGDRPLPDRRLVVAGSSSEVAWDCEQLTVALAAVGWGSSPEMGQGTVPFGTAAGAMAVRYVLYSVQLVRCTPVPDEDGEPPSAEELMAAGLSFQRDAGLLSQALVMAASRLRPHLPRGAVVQAGAIQPVGPQGEYVGMEGEFIVSVTELS